MKVVRRWRIIESKRRRVGGQKRSYDGREDPMTDRKYGMGWESEVEMRFGCAGSAERGVGDAPPLWPVTGQFRSPVSPSGNGSDLHQTLLLLQSKSLKYD